LAARSIFASRSKASAGKLVSSSTLGRDENFEDRPHAVRARRGLHQHEVGSLSPDVPAFGHAQDKATAIQGNSVLVFSRHEMGGQKSSGVSPVFLAIRESILGPISSSSWNAKTTFSQPGRARVRCEPVCRLTVHPMRSRHASNRRALMEPQVVTPP
jgi:hypothetical protein